MNPRIVRYRRRSEHCRDCGYPIDREPQSGGDLHGWEPSCGACYSCYTIDLFGSGSEPSPEWWRKVRRVLRASSELVSLNLDSIPDLGDV